MSDHLPECAKYHPSGDGFDVCICDRLRACEARVREEERALLAVERTTLAELNDQWRKGVQAARDAVADVRASLTFLGAVVVLESINRAEALAAIDALRGDA